MKTILVASRKGGCGKTTLCGHLAVQATLEGKKAAILDTDPQGSLADWWNEREAEEPSFASTDIPGIPAALKELEAASYDYALIDTPPAITDALAELVKVSDLIVVPVRPSPHDLRAIGATVDLLEPGGKPFIFVVNSATKRARLTGEAAIALSQHGKVAPSIIAHRQDFAASMIDGRTAQELKPNSPSASEVTELWDYVTAQLSK